MANENIIGSTSKVVSSRVLGSSNPILKKFGSIGKAIQGVGCGFFLVMISFVLIWSSINGVEVRSKIVSMLDFTSVDQLQGKNGMLKTQGVPSEVTPLNLVLNFCADASCSYTSDNIEAVSNALYFKVNYERYEVKKEVENITVTRVENGNEIEDTIEKTTYKEAWVSKTDNTISADFKLGPMQVLTDKAELLAYTQDKTVENIKIPNFSEPLENYGQTVSSKVGAMRAVISYLPNTKQELFIVGENNGALMRDGKPFIITDTDEAELIRHLESVENMQRTLWMVAAWLACFIGFSMIFAPIIELVDWIPLFGGAAKTAAGIIAFILASVVVAMGFVFIKFWYLFVLFLILAIALAVFLIIKATEKPKTI